MKKFPLLTRFALWILLPFTLITAALYFHFKSNVPDMAGTLDVPGLRAPVRISFDTYGVPSIRAESDRDVFFAMGYLHARDRLWQMELQRRFAQGTLSQILGKSALDQDVIMRTYGLYSAAQASWDALDPAAKESLDAYAEGVNAWLAAKHPLPLEFTLVDDRPGAWTPTDSLVLLKVFSLNLSGNYSREIAQYLAAQTLSSAELSTFFPHHGDSVTGRSTAVRSTLLDLENLQVKLEQQEGIGGPFVGSNAWAIAGKYSDGHGAILSNDPHLALQMPSVWYPVSQNGDKLRTSGMSLVGLPIVVFGQNQDIAWGGTSMMADVQDLYLEEVDPADPGRYRVGDHWERFGVRIERIDVRAPFPSTLRSQPEPVQITIRTTRHGPVVSDALGIPSQPIALRWTALDDGDTTYEAMLEVGYASDWGSLRRALAHYISPALNLVYADRAGNIGLQGIGRIPVRSAGHGDVPGPGWSNTHEWVGFIPYDAMPQSYNPEAGYVVSANDRNVEPDYPYFISNDWAPPGRADRIRQLIESRIKQGGKVDVPYLQRIQDDVVSLPALRLLPALLGIRTTTGRQREAVAYLAKWHGEMDRDSQAASIFNVWVRHLKQKLFSARLNQDWQRRGEHVYFDTMMDSVPLDTLGDILSKGDSSWCQNGRERHVLQCSAVALDALDEALDELRKLAGDDMRDWQWGRVHRADLAHHPFSDVNILKEWFGRRFESGGSSDTVNVANSVFDKTRGYSQTFGSSFRQIMQPGDSPRVHLYINSSGQSGNLFSQHYDDLVVKFSAGDLVSMGGGDQPLSVLTLQPGPSGKGVAGELFP